MKDDTPNIFEKYQLDLCPPGYELGDNGYQPKANHLPGELKHPDDGLYDIPTYEYYQSVFPEPADRHIDWDKMGGKLGEEPHCDFNDDNLVGYCNVPGYNDVDKPYHYNQRSMECIDWIRVCLEGLEGEEAYFIGSALKYIWRCKDKNGAQDLEKAIWFLKKWTSEKSKS